MVLMGDLTFASPTEQANGHNSFFVGFDDFSG